MKTNEFLQKFHWKKLRHAGCRLQAGTLSFNKNCD